MKKMILSIVFMLMAGQAMCGQHDRMQKELKGLTEREIQITRAYNKTKRDGHLNSGFIPAGLTLITWLAGREAIITPSHQSNAIAHTCGLLTLCSIGMPIYKLAQNLKTVPNLGFWGRYGQAIRLTWQHFIGSSSLREKARRIRKQNRQDPESALRTEIATLKGINDTWKKSLDAEVMRNLSVEEENKQQKEKLQDLREELSKKEVSLQKVKAIEVELLQQNKDLQGNLQQELDTIKSEVRRTEQDNWSLKLKNDNLQQDLQKWLQKYKELQDKLEISQKEVLKLRLENQKSVSGEKAKADLQKLAHLDPVKLAEALDLQKELEQKVKILQSAIINLLKVAPLEKLPKNDLAVIETNLGISLPKKPIPTQHQASSIASSQPVLSSSSIASSNPFDLYKANRYHNNPLPLTSSASSASSSSSSSSSSVDSFTSSLMVR